MKHTGNFRPAVFQSDAYFGTRDFGDCNEADFIRLYDLGVANFQAGSYHEAMLFFEKASKRMRSRDMERCGFEDTFCYVVGIRNHLCSLYRQELIENLAASREPGKVQLAGEIRKMMSGFASDDPKVVLESLGGIEDIIHQNGYLPEFEAYQQKNMRLKILHTKSKLFMLDNVFPEAGIEIGSL